MWEKACQAKISHYVPNGTINSLSWVGWEVTFPRLEKNKILEQWYIFFRPESILWWTVLLSSSDWVERQSVLHFGIASLASFVWSKVIFGRRILGNTLCSLLHDTFLYLEIPELYYWYDDVSKTNIWNYAKSKFINFRYLDINENGLCFGRNQTSHLYVHFFTQVSPLL